MPDTYKFIDPPPAGLVLEFEMWRHFDATQKSFTLFDCVDCV